MPTYLDYNATTPVAPEVLEAMQPYWAEEFGNAGSRTHIFGNKALEAVEKARKQIADTLDSSPSEIIFTSGATEANNLSILGLANNPSNKKRHIISSSIEHKAVLEPLDFLSKNGYDIDLVGVDNSGRVNPSDVLSKIRKDTFLLSLMHVNNETGVIQPIRDICSALSSNKDIYIHTDASQGFLKDNNTLLNKRLDLISLSGHKIFGPKGIGALLRRRRPSGPIPLTPLMFGGGQEKGLRPGTLPVPLIVGFGAAVQYGQSNFKRNTEQMINNKIKLLKSLETVNHKINGDQNYSIPSTINISIIDVDSEALMISLKNKISISNGSACTSSLYSPSHVLSAMGLSRKEINESIRISMSFYQPSIDWLDDLLKTILHLQRK